MKKKITITLSEEEIKGFLRFLNEGRAVIHSKEFSDDTEADIQEQSHAIQAAIKLWLAFQKQIE